MIRTIKNSARRFTGNEEGSLQNATWEIGAAVVVALVIVAAMVFFPETARDFWDAGYQLDS